MPTIRDADARGKRRAATVVAAILAVALAGCAITVRIRTGSVSRTIS